MRWKYDLNSNPKEAEIRKTIISKIDAWWETFKNNAEKLVNQRINIF